MNALVLRLEGPLQSWGDVGIDTKRPSRAYPSTSALAGLLASALGWTYRDGERTTSLQSSLRYGVREDRQPRRLRDFQTVNLGRETRGWTHWGIEERGGAFSTGTHIIEKEYLSDGSFAVALRLTTPAPVSLPDLEHALEFPARPLHLGRRSCPPSLPLLVGQADGETLYDILVAAPLAEPSDEPPLRCWYGPGDGPPPQPGREQRVWDQRDFVTDRFMGSRSIIEGRLTPAHSNPVREA